MHDIIQIVVDFAEQIGYMGIFLMMVLESSFFPFPSEVAMIPAGYLASTGKLDFSIALLIGTFGALVGATINYAIGYFLGEKVVLKLVHKYGKYFLISEKGYRKTENYFIKHGSVTTFIGRFITVVRQLISVPAGVFRMNYKKFFFYTGLGAGLWNLMLMVIGYLAGENRDLINKYSLEVFYIVIIIIILVILFYVFVINKIRRLEDRIKHLEKKYKK